MGCAASSVSRETPDIAAELPPSQREYLLYRQVTRPVSPGEEAEEPGRFWLYLETQLRRWQLTTRRRKEIDEVDDARTQCSVTYIADVADADSSSTWDPLSYTREWFLELQLPSPDGTA